VANGALVQSFLQTLVYCLIPPPDVCMLPTLCCQAGAGKAWFPAPAAAQVQDEVVAVAERVLLLVPTAAPRVLPLLVGNLPHKLRDRNTQVVGGSIPGCCQ
jgi:RNA polymerase I-specific transcription initiation factor RRN3